MDMLNARYEASALLFKYGVEVIAIGDPSGARLNSSVRRLVVLLGDDGSGMWEDVVGAAKSLRWRVATQPQPLAFNAAVLSAAQQVRDQIEQVYGGLSSSALQILDELSAAVGAVSNGDSPLGEVLVQSLNEVGASECVVVGANGAAVAGMSGWLSEFGVAVKTVTELERSGESYEQAYAVGPPRFFRPSLITAPTTAAVSFLLPAWFADRSIPSSVIAQYADGAMVIKAKVFFEGDLAEPPAELVDVEIEDELMPQPVWDETAPVRDPAPDEVLARRVLLSGNLAILLDDGERIRSVDPSQPGGERVNYTSVSSVRPGTYLLLRTGETERQALYEAALALIGADPGAVESSQARWKKLLQQRLSQHGHASVVRQLDKLGVSAHERVGAWIEPTLARPRRDRDFELLLQWLGLQLQPFFDNAKTLRRSRARASVNIGEQLESAVAAANMTCLERDGHLRLDVEAGFRGIFATRVLAISPNAEIVARQAARVPIVDRRSQWLE